MKPKRLLALGVLLVGVTLATSLTGAQKSAPAQPTEQQKLKERVDALESSLKELKEKSDDAAKERAYVEKIRSDTKEFYQQAFSSQTWTLAIMGLILTALFSIAGMFGFNIFDRHMQHAVSEATAQLEKRFDEKLGQEREKLEKSNVDQLKQLEDKLQEQISSMGEDLDIRGKYADYSLQGIAMRIAHQDDDAVYSLRKALELYLRGKARHLFERRHGSAAVNNLFRALKRLNPTQPENAVKKELANDLYSDLEDELNAAALEVQWLAPLIKERNEPTFSAPNTTETPTAAPAAAQKPPAPAPDTTAHSPGPLRVFREGEQIGEIVPSDTFRCGGQIPSTPPLELFCERHAKALGYEW